MTIGQPEPEFPPREELRPWLPKTLQDRNFKQETVSSLTYIVVDEIVGTVAGLSLYDWPFADRDGRLRFPMPDHPAEAGIGVEELCRYLHKRGLHFRPTDESRSCEKDRTLRVGHVFAARVTRSANQWTSPPSKWLKDPVDISEEARLLGKLAYFGSVAPAWNEHQVRTLKLRKDLEDEP